MSEAYTSPTLVLVRRSGNSRSHDDDICDSPLTEVATLRASRYTSRTVVSIAPTRFDLAIFFCSIGPIVGRT
ncbi:hypothetical protein Q4I28_005287 [Leishmania naiffi]|uniref:Uncharacterized protein n=1 Tax=Leishmania naiffi TaxID=5678 RepID=A0AAW3BII7_9TRYP